MNKKDKARRHMLLGQYDRLAKKKYSPCWAVAYELGKIRAEHCESSFEESPLTTEILKEMETPTMSEELIRDILGIKESKVLDTTLELDVIPDPEPAEVEVLYGHTELQDGITCVYQSFEEVFGWKPDIPHLVATYEGLDAAPVMEGYILDETMIEEFSLCESLGLKQNLTGPSGCGKTQLVEWYAAKCGRPYMRISHTDSFDKTEVFGRVDITDGDTDFNAGVLPRSFDLPYMVLLDELTRAPSQALMVYGTLLDRRELILPEMKSTDMKPLVPCKGWSVCAADNTKGNGDGMDKYIASNVQDGAFTNRMDVMHECDYLPEYKERELIAMLNTVISEANVNKLATLSSLLHTGTKDGTLSMDFSPRNLQAMSKLCNAGMSLARSFTMNYLSRTPESELQDVRETWRAVFGYDLS